MQVRLEGKDLDFDSKNEVYDSSGIALQRTYGKTFHALQASGGFWLEIVKRDSHIFSKDDIAAGQLNEIASKWLDNIPMSEAVSTIEPQEEPQAHDLVAARPTELAAVSA